MIQFIPIHSIYRCEPPQLKTGYGDSGLDRLLYERYSKKLLSICTKYRDPEQQRGKSRRELCPFT